MNPSISRCHGGMFDEQIVAAKFAMARLLRVATHTHTTKAIDYHIASITKRKITTGMQAVSPHWGLLFYYANANFSNEDTRSTRIFPDNDKDCTKR